MGYYFHWTPEQVGKMDCTFIETMTTILPIWKKKENEPQK